MAIAADPENLQIDAAGLTNRLFIGGAILVVIAPARSIGNVNVCGIDVDVAEKILLHEVAKTLRMIRGQADVFIEVERRHLREIQIFLAVHSRQFGVNTDRRGSGRKAERQRRVSTHCARDNPRRFAVQLIAICLEHYEHLSLLTNSAMTTHGRWER